MFKNGNIHSEFYNAFGLFVDSILLIINFAILGWVSIAVCKIKNSDEGLWLARSGLVKNLFARILSRCIVWKGRNFRVR
jgi:hypothetical protein